MTDSFRDELVSVVVPAYNAEATISETIQSVRGQTHARLEIIVVDDGSTDQTTSIVELHVAADPRVRLVRQANAGVAAARNKGAAMAVGTFIAFVDADDLWRPTKIQRQLEAFALEGPSCGLVYTAFSLIDENSMVLNDAADDLPRGWVFEPLARRNFVGNGSSTLIRANVFRETAGFDCALRASGGEGCEDWKLYCEIAQRHAFGVVEQPLTGYRISRTNMSKNVREMIRSRDLVVDALATARPDMINAFREGRNRMSRYMFHRALREARWSDAAWLARTMATYDPAFLVRTVVGLFSKTFKRAAKSDSDLNRQPFLA